MIVRVSDKLLYCSGDAAPPASPEPVRCPFCGADKGEKHDPMCGLVAAPAPVGPDALVSTLRDSARIYYGRGFTDEGIINRWEQERAQAAARIAELAQELAAACERRDTFEAVSIAQGNLLFKANDECDRLKAAAAEWESAFCDMRDAREQYRIAAAASREDAAKWRKKYEETLGSTFLDAVGSTDGRATTAVIKPPVQEPRE